MFCSTVHLIARPHQSTIRNYLCIACQQLPRVQASINSMGLNLLSLNSAGYYDTVQLFRYLTYCASYRLCQQVCRKAVEFYVVFDH